MLRLAVRSKHVSGGRGYRSTLERGISLQLILLTLFLLEILLFATSQIRVHPHRTTARHWQTHLPTRRSVHADRLRIIRDHFVMAPMTDTAAHVGQVSTPWPSWAAHHSSLCCCIVRSGQAWYSLPKPQSRSTYFAGLTNAVWRSSTQQQVGQGQEASWSHLGGRIDEFDSCTCKLVHTALTNRYVTAWARIALNSKGPTTRNARHILYM